MPKKIGRILGTIIGGTAGYGVLLAFGVKVTGHIPNNPIMIILSIIVGAAIGLAIGYGIDKS